MKNMKMQFSSTPSECLESTSEGRILSRYLTNSAPSCHDACKYGTKHIFKSHWKNHAPLRRPIFSTDVEIGTLVETKTKWMNSCPKLSPLSNEINKKCESVNSVEDRKSNGQRHGNVLSKTKTTSKIDALHQKEMANTEGTRHRSHEIESRKFSKIEVQNQMKFKSPGEWGKPSNHGAKAYSGSKLETSNKKEWRKVEVPRHYSHGQNKRSFKCDTSKHIAAKDQAEQIYHTFGSKERCNSHIEFPKHKSSECKGDSRREFTVRRSPMAEIQNEKEVQSSEGSKAGRLISKVGVQKQPEVTRSNGQNYQMVMSKEGRNTKLEVQHQKVEKSEARVKQPSAKLNPNSNKCEKFQSPQRKTSRKSSLSLSLSPENTFNSSSKTSSSYKKLTPPYSSNSIISERSIESKRQSVDSTQISSNRTSKEMKIFGHSRNNNRTRIDCKIMDTESTDIANRRRNGSKMGTVVDRRSVDSLIQNIKSTDISSSNTERKRRDFGCGKNREKKFLQSSPLSFSDLSPEGIKPRKLLDSASYSPAKYLGKGGSSEDKLKKIRHIVRSKRDIKSSESFIDEADKNRSSLSTFSPSSSLSSSITSHLSSLKEEENDSEHSDLYFGSEGCDTTNAIKTPKCQETDRKTVRKTASRCHESKVLPRSLKFRRGKTVGTETLGNSPRKLKFRQGRTVSDNESVKVDIGRRRLRRRDRLNEKKERKYLLNHVIEETACKLVQTKKSKVKALVGAFETVISLHERKSARFGGKNHVSDR